MRNWNTSRLKWAGLITLIAAMASHTFAYPQDAGSSPARELDSRQIQESIGRYETLSLEQPNSAEVWSNLGVFRAMAGDCGKALPALAHAESLNARLFNPWFFSGYCYSSLHQGARAMESLQRALSLNPQDANAWLLKAQVSRDLGNLVDSLDAVLRAQAASPSNPDAFYFAGKDALDLTAKSYDRVASNGPLSDFYSLFLDGQRNAAQGVWDLALEKYRQASKILPDRPDLDFALGSANLELGQYGEAENSFRHCLKNSESAWARLRLALVLSKESKQAEARELFRSVSPGELHFPAEYGDYLSCAFLLDLPEAARRGLVDAKTKFNNGSQWKDWSSRVESMSSGHSENTRAALRLENLSGVGLSLHFYIGAMQAKGNEFKSLFPSPATYQSFRSDFLAARWMQASGRIIPILKMERQALSPANAFAIGEILQSLSYGWFEQLAADYPDSTPAMKLAAENLSAIGEQQKALEIYQGIVQRDGPSPPILREMARIYWADHKWEQAMEILQPLSQMDPNDATVFVNIGRIDEFEQKPDDAVTAFEHAIRIDAGMSEAHLGLGQVLRKQGNLQRALEEFQNASRLDPMNPKPHYELSQIYGKLGDRDLAAREMASFQQMQTIASAQARQSNKMLVPLD